jgi:hypothetical protein
MLYKETIKRDLENAKRQLDDIEIKQHRGIRDTYKKGLKDGQELILKTQIQMLEDYIKFMEGKQ